MAGSASCSRLIAPLTSLTRSARLAVATRPAPVMSPISAGTCLPPISGHSSVPAARLCAVAAPRHTHIATTSLATAAEPGIRSLVMTSLLVSRHPVQVAAGQGGLGRLVGAEIRGAVDAQQLGQPHPAAIGPALDGAGRTPADLRGFVVGKAGYADEHERLALVVRQLRQGTAEFGEADAAFLLGLHRHGAGEVFAGIGDFAATLAVFVA